MQRANRRAAFTLIELLIVVAITAVIAVTLVLTLNPAELIRQGRDSNRIAELNSLNKALSLVESQITGASFGASTTVYVSVPDSSSTCTNLGLPSLPAGYTYNCVTTSSLRNVNGTGWVPVNFAALESGHPLSVLPIDPTNTTTTGQYYTYIPGGSWELGASVESVKYGTKALNDGGDDIIRIEIGSDLALNPQHGIALWLDASRITGLSDGAAVAQWNDVSGFARHATQAVGASQPTYRTNVLNGKPVVRFDGTDDRLAMPTMSWGTAVAVAKRTATPQSLWERAPCCSSAKRGFTVIGAGSLVYETFDQYYVNGVAVTTPASWSSTMAVVSGSLDSAVLTGTAYLGYGSPGFAYLNGDIAEVMVWSYRLSNADRKKAEQYLGAKYGIAVQ